MGTPLYSILLDSKDLTFTARHFITLSLPEKGLTVEPVHEHEFRVTAQIRGHLNDEGLLIDFHTAHALLKEVLSECQGKYFLASRQKGVRFTCDLAHYRFWIPDEPAGRWNSNSEVAAVPLEKGILLDAVNASAETIALHLAQIYYGKLADSGLIAPDPNERLLTVTLEEYPGMKAVVTI